MKTRLLAVIYIFAFYTGLIHLFYWLNRHNPVVITYHNVIPDKLFDRSPQFVSHSVTVFRYQVQLICMRFFPSPWPPPRMDFACILTFDDGYKNQWVVAGPILKEHSAPAIYFIPFSILETKKCLIVDLALKWFSHCPPGTYEIFGSPVTIKEGFRNNAFVEIYRGLLAAPENWDKLEAELARVVPFSEIRINEEFDKLRFTPLDPNDLSEILEAGHQVGCHSWSHLPLASLARDRMLRDFNQCREARDRYTNTRLYSYPFGRRAEVNLDVCQECENNGFEAAFVNVDDVSWHEGNPRFALPRMDLPNTTNRYVLEAKLSGFENALKRLLRRQP